MLLDGLVNDTHSERCDVNYDDGAFPGMHGAISVPNRRRNRPMTLHGKTGSSISLAGARRAGVAKSQSARPWKGVDRECDSFRSDCYHRKKRICQRLILETIPPGLSRRPVNRPTPQRTTLTRLSSRQNLHLDWIGGKKESCVKGLLCAVTWKISIFLRSNLFVK